MPPLDTGNAVVKARLLAVIVVATAAPIFGVTSVGDVASTTAPAPVEVVEPVPPLDTGNAVVKARLLAVTARPAVKSETATFTVALLCTIGKTSVPASGVVALVSSEIFWSAISKTSLNYSATHAATSSAFFWQA